MDVVDLDRYLAKSVGEEVNLENKGRKKGWKEEKRKVQLGHSCFLVLRVMDTP